MAGGQIAAAAGEAAKKMAKPAALAVAAWLAKHYGDKVADEGFNKVKHAADKKGIQKNQEALARELCRTRGWRYQLLVVDHAQRFVVWNDDLRPMAVFPPIEDVRTPEDLASRFELDGYTPPEVDLITPT